METPGNTLHAPHTHKPDAGGKSPSRFTPSLSLHSPFLYLHPLPSYALSLSSHTNPQPPTLLPSFFSLPPPPQLRPCYCRKLWQERQQLRYSRPHSVRRPIILRSSCPFKFKPQSKGRIIDWNTDSEVISSSKGGDNWIFVEAQSQTIRAAFHPGGYRRIRDADNKDMRRMQTDIKLVVKPLTELC